MAGQKGGYERKGQYWVFRYRVRVVENGQTRTMQRAKRLGLVADFPPKRHKGKDGKDVPNAIVALGDEFLADLMQKPTSSSASSNGADGLLIRVGDFVEKVYLPFVATQKKPSTHKDYSDIWNVHLKARASNVWIRDVHTHTVQAWLDDIEANDLTKKLTDEKRRTLSEDEFQEYRAAHKLTHASLARIKSFLSGVFKLALQRGYLKGTNPAKETTVPKGRTSGETRAYDLAVAQKIITALKEPYSTICAVAAYSGLRLGEILGLRWQDYSGASLRVAQCVWRGQIVPPKTLASQDDVPVVSALKSKLDLWNLQCGEPGKGLIFPNESGEPLNESNLDRAIRRELKKAKLPWYRFHAFRRGVATNLHDIGVNDLTIQRVLRHSDVAVTRRAYIKRLPSQVADAMSRFEEQIAARAQEKEPPVQ